MKPQPSSETAIERPSGGGNERPRLWRSWVPPFLLFVIVAWAFLPSIRNEFIEYDDSVYVYHNEWVKSGLTFRGLRWAFTDFSTGNWHPLTWVTHMLDATVYGSAAWGHHLTSVLLHAGNTVLLFVVARRMTGRTWASLAAAALFGLHPMRVESVAWICERKDVLSGFFWLASLWAYARFAEGALAADRKGRGFYYASLVLFVCGLMSKPVMVTFPFALLLVDFWPLRRGTRANVAKLLLEKIPFFLLTALLCVVTFGAQKHTGMMNPLADLRWSERLLNVPVAYVRYLAKTFWPADLCALYPHPGHWPVVIVVGAALLLLAISAFVLRRRQQQPCLLMGWCWFLGTLVPMIGIVQVGAQSMADRYSYVPVIGLWLALVFAAAEVLRRVRPATVTAVVCVLAVVSAALTRQQITHWRDNLMVWRRALAVTEANYEAHYRLARALALQSDLEGAIAEFTRVVQLRPGFAEAQYSLGKALALRGRLDEALARFQRAVELDPTNVVALNNAGNLLLQRGRNAEAMANFRRVLELQPDNAPAHSNLGYALVQAGQLDEALPHLQRAVELQPQNASALNNLGSVYLQRGAVAEAAQQFRRAGQLEPGSVEAHSNLGSALLALGAPGEAVASFRAAVALQPQAAELRRNLGLALSQQGRWDDAILELEQAVRLKPDYEDAKSLLANARARKAAAGNP